MSTDWERIFGEESREREPKGSSKSRFPSLRDVSGRERQKRKKEETILYSPQFRTSKNVILGEQDDVGVDKKYQIGFISIFFIFISVSLNVWLMIKYAQQDTTNVAISQFIFQNAISFMLVGIGITLNYTFVNKNLHAGRLNKRGLFALGIGALAFGISVIVQVFVQAFFKMSVAPIDLYFIFITLSVSEEMCFRYGVQASIESVIEDYSGSRIISALIAVPLASVLFMLVHFSVYTQLVERLVVFGIGCVFGGFFAWTRNTDTNVVAHFLTNVVAGIFYITATFGGF